MEVEQMSVVTTTVKGQVVIPARIRRKFGIVKGTPVHIYEEEDRIIVEPVHEDPVRQGRGLLKSGGKVLSGLIKDRAEEAIL